LNVGTIGSQLPLYLEIILWCGFFPYNKIKILLQG